MKLRFSFPLYAQIISVFLLNILVLLFIWYGLVCIKFNGGWETLIYSHVVHKIRSLAFSIHRRILEAEASQPVAREISPSELEQILEQYSEFCGMKLSLFTFDGEQIAGKPVSLPPEVAERIKASRSRIGMIAHWHGGRGPLLGGAAPSPGSFFYVRTGHGPHSLEAWGPPSHDPWGPPPHEAGVPPPHEAGGPPPHEAGGPPPHDAGGPPHPDGPLPHVPPLMPIAFAAPLEQDKGYVWQMNALNEMLFPPPRVARFIIHTRQPEMFWVPVMMPLGHRPQGVVLVASTASLWQTPLVMDLGPVFGMAVAILCLSLIVWWPFVYGITGALGRLTRATEKIAEGTFDTALKINRRDEIGRLAQAINSMSCKLHSYVAGQKRFLGDIAHELCSPIARLQIALEILESKSVAGQENTIKDIREEVEQMSALINELLAFSKAGLRGNKTELLPVDLKTLLITIIERFRSEAQFVPALQDNLFCLGDQVLIERAFNNIIRNAVRYAGACGPIDVQASSVGEAVVVTITDSGEGVPPEVIEQLGQPFYRPESSRSRSSGGVGLGLSIVKTCIEACEGSVLIRNHAIRGLTVEIKLKKASAPPSDGKEKTDVAEVRTG